MQTHVAAHHSIPGENDDRALASAFVAYTVTATFWLLFATAVGVLLAYKFGAPDFAPGEWLTFGRLRPIHTNATFFGWASLALVGLAYYVAARSSGTRLYSVKLAWIGLLLFNVAALAGTVALDLGYNDGNLEYREWPWPIRLIFLAALVITAWNLIGTVAHRGTEDIYLSNWYTIGGVLWTCIIALVAILPWYQYGLGQVSVSGYYMHNAVGMWFTPLALGIFYYALPKVAEPPDLLLRAWRVCVLDQPGVLPDHRRAPFSVQPAAVVAANHGHRLQRRDAGAGVGWQRQFSADDARAIARSGAFLPADVHPRRRDRLSGRLHPGHLRGVPLAAGGVASDQFHGRAFASDHVRLSSLSRSGAGCTHCCRWRPARRPASSA